MYSPTYAELKLYLQKELDLEGETFITAQEFLGYFQEAIDMTESTIHSIYEDYFLTSSTLSLVSGIQTVSPPSDIYAQKIRSILYNDGGSTKYEIRRIKQFKETNYFDVNDAYKYLVTNDGTNGLKLKFFPVPQETSSNITIWYIRNAKRPTADTDIIDIPEFTSVIVQYVRVKCLSKEGHPDAGTEISNLDRMRQEMVETLTARIPDEDNSLLIDFSFYQEFDDWRWGGYY